ncbi:TPA: hypothetical protein ACGQK4_002194 [Elizabethkingia anophelis]|nr:hypothetical protein [Elizabethkingia anophelis]
MKTPIRKIFQAMSTMNREQFDKFMHDNIDGLRTEETIMLYDVCKIASEASGRGSVDPLGEILIKYELTKKDNDNENP